MAVDAAVDAVAAFSSDVDHAAEVDRTLLLAVLLLVILVVSVVAVVAAAGKNVFRHGPSLEKEQRHRVRELK